MRTTAELNRSRGLTKGEAWMKLFLDDTPYKWTEQAQWGYRIFDFWCHAIGTAVEVDGKNHSRGYDRYRDEYNFRRSGIVVIRVSNFSLHDAQRALAIIDRLGEWIPRKKELGIYGHAKMAPARRSLSMQEFNGHSMLEKYVDKLLCEPNGQQ